MKELAKDRELTDFIIELNTIEQLYNKGIDSTGTRLDSIRNGYSPFTIKKKQEKGQPTDRVTLRDSGYFYASWKVFLNSKSDFEITADPIKDGVSLLVEWGKNVLGLSPDSQDKFNAMVKSRMPDIVLQLINRYE